MEKCSGYQSNLALLLYKSIPQEVQMSFCISLLLRWEIECGFGNLSWREATITFLTLQ